jgi:hypothetical protein
VELRVIRFVVTVVLAVLAQNNVRDAHRLSAMAAYYATEMLRRQFGGHEDYSLDRLSLAVEAGEYRMAREVVHREDSRGVRKKVVTVVTGGNIDYLFVFYKLQMSRRASFETDQARGVEEGALGSHSCNGTVT